MPTGLEDVLHRILENDSICLLDDKILRDPGFVQTAKGPFVARLKGSEMNRRHSLEHGSVDQHIENR